MPENSFPDSREKRELRRRDLRRLIEHRKIFPTNRYSYCGLPGVEFQDIKCWKNQIRSVTAFEYSRDDYDNMLIERDRCRFDFPVEINPKQISDIIDFLCNAEYSFDLYNLDFLGGWIYRSAGGETRAVAALRTLFARQASARRTFFLVTTFNVRDKGANEYSVFLDGARDSLAGRSGAASNLRTHDKNQLTRLKLCFPYFCAQQCHANGFQQHCGPVIAYQSSAVMLHFMQLFVFEGLTLPTFSHSQTLIELANRPLYQIHGQVVKIRDVFPTIE